MNTLPLALNGTTELPPGKIAAIVTYFVMRQRPRLAISPSGLGLVRLGAADAGAYLALFRLIGAPWLWFSRLQAGEAAAADLLADPRVEAYAVEESGITIGLLELDFRRNGEAEIAFLGLVQDAIGRGLGRQLMQEALARAWAQPIGRLLVHTCTLDHPAALPFYRSAGFVAYKIGVEVTDDPRLCGLFDRDSARTVPIVAGN
jgi:GNAT superfamily N-acetyltransferase